MKLIAIFPARHNSNRLLNKNFKYFFGRPMLAWPLHEAVQSELFDKIVISTDKRIDFVNQIKDNGGLTNVDVHIRRGNVMKYDSTVDDICLEVLDKYKDYDYVCCIYPTAYAVTWKDLCKSFGRLTEYVNSICSNIMLNHDRYGTPKESDNGGFYYMKVKNFLKDKKLNTGLRYELPMVDINTMQDFSEAKLYALTLEDGRFK